MPLVVKRHQLFGVIPERVSQQFEMGEIDALLLTVNIGGHRPSRTRSMSLRIAYGSAGVVRSLTYSAMTARPGD
jgi:hypothetical protein